jgi:hypothetical protein
MNIAKLKQPTVQTSRAVLYAAVPLLIVAVLLGWPQAAVGDPQGYSFKAVAFLGDSPPGCGCTLVNDFEPSGILDGGDVVFTADVASGGESVFLVQKGQIFQIAHSDLGELGRIGFNQNGQAVVGLLLNPSTLPIGVNGAVYRFSKQQGLTPVLTPNITAAPGGGTFAGTFFNMGLNNSGVAVFPGLVTGADIMPGPPGVDGLGLGMGLFQADKHGTISSVVRPGDPAPGGHIFDWAANGWVNDGGDIAFGAHVEFDACVDFGNPQSFEIFCGESVYLKHAATGVIQSIAHQGDPAPGGGHYGVAFGPVVNNSGDIVFIGDLSSPVGTPSDQYGVFLFSKGATIAVARPGDAMPGGGHLLSAGSSDATYFINNPGDVSFSAVLDTTNGSGVNDTGVYVYSKAKPSLRLVARTGTPVLGSTIKNLGPPAAFFGGTPPAAPTAQFGGIINEQGQVLFSATLADGRVALLVGTPTP